MKSSVPQPVCDSPNAASLAAPATASWNAAVLETLGWMRRVMMPAPDGRHGVWERVRINLNAIQYWVRPDCSSEAARVFLLCEQLLNEPEGRATARNLLRYVLRRQLIIGPFPFYEYAPPDLTQSDPVRGGLGIWPNDNGKVLTILGQLAPEFPELDITAAARRLGDYFLANQKPEGWWRLDGTDYPGTCFVTWPLAALSRLWKLTGAQAYREAALRALECLKTLQLPDGRMRTSYEVNGVENWRPVSSETAMSIIGFAAAQECLEVDLDRQIRGCADFTLALQSETGAIRNCDATCLEASEQNNPDLADMVYTNGYALQGLLLAHQATGLRRYRDAAFQLADFLARIRCQGESPLWDGAWRGSYDTVRNEWSGRADQHNELDEGGMYSAYTGWCAMPIVTGLLLSLAAVNGLKEDEQ